AQANPGPTPSRADVLAALRTRHMLTAPLGTLDYMAPEQLTRSVEQDSRIDVYAIGAVLYEMLCGEVPYDARTADEMRGKHRARDMISLADRLPDLHRGVAEVVATALAVEPAARFPTTAALASALRALQFPPTEAPLAEPAQQRTH